MPTPQTTRLLELGAADLRDEKRAEARVDINFHRDAIRNLATRIANGEAVDAPQRQLEAAIRSMMAALERDAQWAARTPASIAADAITDIQNDPQ